MKPKLSNRWTDAQKDRAMQIVNDIAEYIDNRESRKDLRMALAIYADWLCEARCELDVLRATTKMADMLVKLRLEAKNKQ